MDALTWAYSKGNEVLARKVRDQEELIVSTGSVFENSWLDLTRCLRMYPKTENTMFLFVR